MNNFIPNGFGLKFIEKKFYSMGTNGRILIYSKDKLIGLHAINMAIKRINEIQNDGGKNQNRPKIIFN